MAQQVIYTEDQKQANLQGVTGQAFGPQGKPIAHFAAPAGRYDQQTKHITLLNGVTVTSKGDTPITLKAPMLDWKTNAPEALATGGVTIVNKAFGTSTASRCQFTLDFKRVSLSGNAVTRVH
jgi:lipopolysaccharide assembly outer membrane protein LptD (OstA)